MAGTANTNLGGTIAGFAFIAQFTAKGALDPNFGTQGRTFTALGSTTSILRGLAQQPGGLIAAIGTAGTANVAIFSRFTPQGNLDPNVVDPPSGNHQGFYSLFLNSTEGAPAAITLDPGGKLVVAGATSGRGTYLARMVGDSGSLDDTFTGSLSVPGIDQVGQLGTDSFPTGVAVQSDGKYVIVGNKGPEGGRSPFIARIFPNQIFDAGFGNAGVVTPTLGGVSNQFQSMALDSDGRILVAGVESMAFGSGIPDQLLLYRFWP